MLAHRLRALALILGLGLAVQAPAPVRAEVLTLTPDEALMTARAAYLAGDVAVAGHIARALVAVEPDNTRVHLLLAATEPKLGRADAGLIAGRRAWKLAASSLAGRSESMPAMGMAT